METPSKESSQKRNVILFEPSETSTEFEFELRGGWVVIAKMLVAETDWLVV